MLIGTDFIQEYTKSTRARKVEIIIKYYPSFMGYVDGSTFGLLRDINDALEDSRKKNRAEELGVRIQNKGLHSDPTNWEATAELITEQAVIDCKFPRYFWEEIVNCEIYMEQAKTLRAMREDFQTFNKYLGSLGEGKEEFMQFIKKKKTITDLAEEFGIVPESERRKLVRYKSVMKQNVMPYIKGEVA